MKNSTWIGISWVCIFGSTILFAFLAGRSFVNAYTEVGFDRYFSLATGLIFLAVSFFFFNMMYPWKNLWRKLRNKQGGG